MKKSNSRRKLLVVVGTRPEAIKMLPIIVEANKSPFKNDFEVSVCMTGQHTYMVDDVFGIFGIKESYYLSSMTPGQSLSELTGSLFKEMDKVLDKNQNDYADFDWILVEGDTTSAFIASLIGFYYKIPVAHVEAGMRTFNRFSPFPEEMNRMLISRLASIHFAPSAQQKVNLFKEGIVDNVWVTGNTVIDACKLALQRVDGGDKVKWRERLNSFSGPRDIKIILLTLHRREKSESDYVAICDTVKRIVEEYSYRVIIPVHPSPRVDSLIRSKLFGYSRIHLVEPMTYTEFVWLMRESHIIMTDSGGVQEEATFLQKPLLILREETERVEVLNLSNFFLTGSNPDKIMTVFRKLQNPKFYNSVTKSKAFPYGKGDASKKILRILRKK